MNAWTLEINVVFDNICIILYETEDQVYCVVQDLYNIWEVLLQLWYAIKFMTNDQ